MNAKLLAGALGAVLLLAPITFGQDERNGRDDGERKKNQHGQRQTCAPASAIPLCPSLPRRRERGCAPCAARSGLGLARRAHGAAIRT